MSVRTCPSCHKEISGDFKFCPECGSSLGTSKAKQTKGNVKKGKSNSTRDAIIIIGALVLIAGGYFIINRPATPEHNHQPQQQQQQSGNYDHPEVEGMEGGMGAAADLPTDYNGLVQAGNNYMDLGNFALAAESYKRALKIDGSSPDVRTDYGACLHGMGLEQRALEEFYTVIKDHPKHGISHFNLGIVYYGLHEADSAKLYWNKYLELEPSGQAADKAREKLKEMEK